MHQRGIRGSDFAAKLVRFRDADTPIVDIDLGFGVMFRTPVRLVGLESWELDGPDRARALSARVTLDKMFGGEPCRLTPQTQSLDRYGRVRGRVEMSTGDLCTVIVKCGLGWLVPLSHTHAKKEPEAKL